MKCFPFEWLGHGRGLRAWHSLILWNGCGPRENPAGAITARNLSPRATGVVCAAIAVLSFLAYARALQLPFIADDYVQIALGREYGALSGWPALLHDVLYRCRATSLILTYWTDRWFGADPFIFHLSSLLIHILNSLLVFAMGMWRPIGWRVSAVAACFFAVSQRHHEAVIWYAALPELLVFFFILLSFLSWVRWLQSESGSTAPYWASFAFYGLAMLSKESAVTLPPLLLLAGVFQRRDLRVLLARILPFALCAVGYFGLIFAARHTHLHFNDAGTFSLDAPFVQVLLRSSWKLAWFWGVAAIVALLVWKAREWSRLLWIASAWVAITFLPYCFLTYMPSVPSRHTYLASVGMALLVAVALVEFHARTAPRHGRAGIALLSGVMILHQCSYLWIIKQAQFEIRAQPTERLLKMAALTRSSIHVKCFPYDRSVADLALQIRGRDTAPTALVFDTSAAIHDDGVDFCFDPGQYHNLP
ncbi:MAG: hypothetical protein ABI822_29750 [Bryobacteraceae bacterium]